jgi:hypothetical protein
MRERQQLEHSGAAGQALSDPLHQQQVLRAGEDELAGDIPMGIDVLLDVRQQVRCVLHLIKGHRRGVELEKGPWIVHRGAAHIQGSRLRVMYSLGMVGSSLHLCSCSANLHTHQTPVYGQSRQLHPFKWPRLGQATSFK